MKKIISFGLFMACLPMGSCSDDFLEIPLQGQLDETTVASSPEAVNQLLIGAYSALDGLSATSAWWGASHTNFIWGDIASDDAYTGGITADLNFGVAIAVETFAATPGHSMILDKWRACYDGVLRSNLAIQAISQSQSFSDTEANKLMAEALFLRAFYHFEAKKVWNNVPFINNPSPANIENTADIWPLIEADLQFAYTHLPVTQQNVGRVTKYAASALLAKAHLYQHDYTAAKPLLDEIITSNRYRLVDNIIENLNVAGNNNTESVFEIQSSINDAALGYESNLANIYNLPHVNEVSGQGGGGMLAPSQNLINAFKTDNNGLPFLDTFNDTDVTSDEGLSASDPFTPYVGNLDPRLDFTVGRRGIPYLDWGICEGWNWTRGPIGGTGGPYSNKKYVFSIAEKDAGLASTGAQGWIFGNTSANHRLIRYAQVLLWAAEVEVEIGSLEKARGYVNDIRRRAKNSNYVQDNGNNAANYVINEYASSWTDKNFAKKAVHYESRLELALEGHRFFDLVRWGEAPDVLNSYFEKEKLKRIHLSAANFVAGKHEYFPLPQQELDLLSGLNQNPGY